MQSTKNLSAATKIYSGASSCCRCGCKGTYAEAGTKLFTSRLKKMQAMLDANQGTVDVDDSYIDVTFGNDRALTAYFD